MRGASDQQPAAPVRGRVLSSAEALKAASKAPSRVVVQHELDVLDARAPGDLVDQDALLALLEIGDQTGRFLSGARVGADGLIASYEVTFDTEHVLVES